MNKALCVAKPGNTAEDIYNAYNNIVMRVDNLGKQSRIGYSFGIGYPPDWGEKTLSCRPNDKTVLKKGMCLHLIAGCGDGFDYEYSEAIVITDEYPELLCKTPRGLFIKENHNDTISYLDSDLNLCSYNLIQDNLDLNSIDFELKYIKGLRNTADNKLNNQSQDLYNELTGELSNKAFEYHHSIIIERTPLVLLSGLSKKLSLGKILIKDESCRLSLNSFKVLGVSFAIDQMFKNGKIKKGDTLTTMTDGNHGLALAHVASDMDLKCVIYAPKNIVRARVNRIKGQGAEVIIIDGTYDEVVEYVKQQAQLNNWTLVADHSWEGYTDIPRNIMIGYTTLYQEAFEQAKRKNNNITHIFIQAGVGGLAGAGAAWCEKERRERAERGEKNSRFPRLICVESTNADCLLESAKNQCLSTCKGNTDSIMAGLNCGTPSLIAWPLLNDTVDIFLAIGDEWAKEAMRVLKHASGPDRSITSGESGAASFAGLLSIMTKNNNISNELKEILELDETSVVLCINSEGDTDPKLYKEIVKRKPRVIKVD